jgi:hypothetical protein
MVTVKPVSMLFCEVQINVRLASFGLCLGLSLSLFELLCRGVVVSLSSYCIYGCATFRPCARAFVVVVVSYS